MFLQLSIFTADCLPHTVQIAGIETIWELHTLTVINSCVGYISVNIEWRNEGVEGWREGSEGGEGGEEGRGVGKE